MSVCGHQRSTSQHEETGSFLPLCGIHDGTQVARHDGENLHHLHQLTILPPQLWFVCFKQRTVNLRITYSLLCKFILCGLLSISVFPSANLPNSVLCP